MEGREVDVDDKVEEDDVEQGERRRAQVQGGGVGGILGRGIGEGE
jgi:hypothetical protein